MGGWLAFGAGCPLMPAAAGLHLRQWLLPWLPSFCAGALLVEPAISLGPLPMVGHALPPSLSAVLCALSMLSALSPLAGCQLASAAALCCCCLQSLHSPTLPAILHWASIPAAAAAVVAGCQPLLSELDVCSSCPVPRLESAPYCSIQIQIGSRKICHPPVGAVLCMHRRCPSSLS